MADRFQHLKNFWGAWGDPDTLRPALAEDFVCHDPTEAQPVTRDGMAAWMERWQQRFIDLGGSGQVTNSAEVEADQNGVLTHWHFWQGDGTDLEGAALVKVSDAGVFYQKVFFYKAKLPE